jgi:nucleotidyltransferase substrate binding protein (TIGR01987 family)
MTQLDYSALRSALLALELGFAEHAAYPQLLTVRDGVIQRFEIAMDLSWKMLQRTLKARFEVTELELLTKKDIFRQAAKFALIDDTERWFGHYDARNETSHIYDNAIAEATFARARLFLVDAKATLAKLEKDV